MRAMFYLLKLLYVLLTTFLVFLVSHSSVLMKSIDERRNFEKERKIEDSSTRRTSKKQGVCGVGRGEKWKVQRGGCHAIVKPLATKEPGWTSFGVSSHIDNRVGKADASLYTNQRLILILSFFFFLKPSCYAMSDDEAEYGKEIDSQHTHSSGFPHGSFLRAATCSLQVC